MKKLLSVLLAMIMVISCCSIGFVVFAEDTTPEQEAVDKLNAAIQKAVTEVKDEQGNVTFHTPGYGYSMMTNAMSVIVTPGSDEYNTYYLNPVINSFDEFSKFRTVETGDKDGDGEISADEKSALAYDFNAIGTYILTDSFPKGIDLVKAKGEITDPEEFTNLVSEVTTKSGEVIKNSDGKKLLGDDALNNVKLNASKVESVEDGVLHYADIDVMAGDKPSKSVFTDFTKFYPNLANVLSGDYISRAEELGVEIEDNDVKYTNIRVEYELDGENLMSLRLVYNIEASLTLNYMDKTYSITASSEENSIAYEGFEYYNEGEEFDLAELANKINSATAYAVDTKAGYKYTRAAATDNDSSIQLVLTPDTYNMISELTGKATDALVGAYDQVTIAIDKNGGTSLTTYQWNCYRDGKVKGTGEDAKECPVCAGNSEDCKKGDHGADSGCICEEKITHIFDTISIPGVGDINASTLVNKGVAAAMEKANESVSNKMKEAVGVGAYSATVPNQKIDDKYALKKTELDVTDIAADSAEVQPDGSIKFYLNDQAEANGAGLKHLTNDFVEPSTIRDNMAGKVFEALGTVIGKIQGVDVKLEDMGELAYSDANEPGAPIPVVVKFEGADEQNPYGNGHIEKLDVNYRIDYNIAIGMGDSPYIEGTAGAYINSNYKNFKYEDIASNLGDADFSGRVSIYDAKLVLRYVAKLETFTEPQLQISDMDKNGVVDTVDARRILKKVAETV